MKHFVELCVDSSLKTLRFALVVVVNNFENVTSDEIDDLLLINYHTADIAR